MYNSIFVLYDGTVLETEVYPGAVAFVVARGDETPESNIVLTKTGIGMMMFCSMNRFPMLDFRVIGTELHVIIGVQIAELGVGELQCIVMALKAFAAGFALGDSNEL